MEQDDLPRIGQPAPEFVLDGTYPSRVRLSDYRGHTVLLAFYPLDFSGG